MNLLHKKTKSLVLMAVFTAIIIIQSAVPVLGYIPLGIMNATIIHITVIIGAVVLGVKEGMLLGLVFAFTSLYRNTLMPNPTSFVFSPFVSIGTYSGDFRSLIVCFVPRILIGLSSAFVFYFLHKRNKTKVALISAGLVGSLVNTIFVMSFIYLLFGHDYAMAVGKDIDGLVSMILMIIFTQGIAEAIVSAVLTYFVGASLIKALR